MNKIFTLTMLPVAIFLSSFALLNIDEVVNALKNGNAEGIARYFDNTVEITLPAKSGSYSKGQAAAVLTDFFKNNPVRNFEILHKGENSGSQYCIGTLVTRNGTYRTTVFMKQKNGVHLLQEIRFETQ
ncbi:MAG: DUF4783 domain-containing protein [Chitinophagaceae bacterium]|nr:DUF4783 domain-containing protein [Chitinophagaceae bacterium]